MQRELLITRQESNRYEQRFHEASAALEMAHQREADAAPPTPAPTPEPTKEQPKQKYTRPATPIKVRPAPTLTPSPEPRVEPKRTERKAPQVTASVPDVDNDRVIPKLAAVAPVAESAPRPEHQPVPVSSIRAFDESDDDEITEDEINDMITEFKLGIRSKIG